MEQGLYCVTCGRQTVHKSEPVNHVLRALFFIFTCCLWGIPWYFFSVAAANKPLTCTVCGTAFDAAKASAAHGPTMP